MAKELKIAEPRTLAMELQFLDRDVAALEERRAEIKGQLMEILKKQGVRQVRLDDGTMYIRMDRKSLVVKDERKAYAWATENHALQIDKSKSLKIFQRIPMPRFFGTSTTEYLTVRRAKDNASEESV